ncbi:MAG TPA: HAD-IA family hydrolase [Pyrinomonadaceae bacterium]|nr:HAD-IA family hydrolase [Pyrinomonadaceae bacterium]
MNLKCLFFDLDGTLIDSRDDLADSVNLTLSELGLEKLPPAMIYNFIGEGVFNLIDRSISASLRKASTEEFSNRGVEIFRGIYNENCLVKTKLYDGVKDTLAELKDFKKAVITNKPHEFSEKILSESGILQHFQFVAGGDSFSERKPNAMPLLKTAEILGFLPTECLMIGDSRVDIEAGKNAEMKTCGCVFGFRGRAELEKAGADYLIEKFADLMILFEL